MEERARAGLARYCRWCGGPCPSPVHGPRGRYCSADCMSAEEASRRPVVVDLALEIVAKRSEQGSESVVA